MIIDQSDFETISFLENLVEAGKGSFPVGFLEYTEYSEERISHGVWPGVWAERAGHDQYQKGISFARAALEELKTLFCGNDRKYSEVRKAGKNFGKVATTAIAGFVAGRFGVEQAVATSAVAATVLVVFKVGVESFCRASKSGRSQ